MLRLATARRLAVLILFLSLFFTKALPASASSLWAAAGDKSKDGGTLAGMTWDVPQGAKGELRLVIPRTGFRYLGLFLLDSTVGQYAVAGVNERGLTILTASADTEGPKKKLKGSANVVETLLIKFGTVDDALSNRQRLGKSRLTFLLLADQAKAAVVQIGSRGNCTVEVTGNGLLYQTNHYTHQKLLIENNRCPESSLVRLSRLQDLLVKRPGPFTVDDFLSVAGDTNNGPDNSIWRTGGSTGHHRTLASWVLFLPRNLPPESYFRLVNPGSNELYYEMRLDKSFWTEGTE